MPDTAIVVGDDIILPIANIPTVTPLDPDDMDVFFDNKEMEEQLERYKTAANGIEGDPEQIGIVQLHTDWVEAFSGWNRRYDDINSKMQAIDELEVITVDTTPGEGYEEFKIFGIPPWVTGAFSILSSLYGIYSARAAFKSAGAVAKTAAQVKKIKRNSVFSGAAAVATLIAGIALIIAEGINRGKFLKQELGKFDDWIDGATDDINEIKAGVLGREATESQEAVEGIIPYIRALAASVDIVNEDDNRMYEELVTYLNTVLADAGQLKGRLQVVSRMICRDHGKVPYTPPVYTFSDEQIVQATGLEESIVTDRRSALSADEWGAIADPPRNYCEGFM